MAILQGFVKRNKGGIYSGSWSPLPRLEVDAETQLPRQPTPQALLCELLRGQGESPGEAVVVVRVAL